MRGCGADRRHHGQRLLDIERTANNPPASQRDINGIQHHNPRDNDVDIFFDWRLLDIDVDIFLVGGVLE